MSARARRFTRGIGACAAIAMLGLGLLHAADADADADADAASAAEAELERHRALWAAHAPAAYEYRYQKYCDCNRDAPPVIAVQVAAGAVVGVRFQQHGFDQSIAVDADHIEYYWTIDELFQLIDTALGTYSDVRVAYDAELGYPRTLYVDRDPGAIGDELDLRLIEVDQAR